MTIDEDDQIVIYYRWNGESSEPAVAECTQCGNIFSERKSLAERKCPRCENSALDVISTGVPTSTIAASVHPQKSATALSAHDRKQSSSSVIHTTFGKSEKTMAAALPTIPAVPDETTLARDIPGRPDWQMIDETLAGTNGKELYAMEAEGAQAIDELTALQTSLKTYLPAFRDWYWSSPFGRAKKAIDEIDEALRLAEERRVKVAYKRIGEINGEFLQARDDERQANERRLAEKQRREAEESKRQALAALEAEKAAAPAEQIAEVQQQIEEVKSAPVVPVSVSKAQAEVGLPSAPAKVSGKRVYVRRIENTLLFLRWLAEHSDYAATLGLTVSFAKLKNNSMVIPGIAVEEKFETSNRGR